jgi:hypothetical protein
MVRYRGKKALYEVMSQIRQKAGSRDTVERLHPVKSEQEKPVVENNTVFQETTTTIPWWKKPRIVQLTSGRIELSVSYQIAVVVVLVFVLLLIITFRIGQYSAPTAREKTSGTAVNTGTNTTNARNRPDTGVPATASNRNTGSGAVSGSAAGTGTAAVVPASTGNNVIVIKQYRAKADLVPVQEYFEKNNILTEIVSKTDGTYFLQTKARFAEDPKKAGTEGNKLLNIIVELGKKYVAPVGCASFAPNYFNDAYGSKVN